MKKRFLGILLSLAMLVSCMPVTALAEENTGSVIEEETYGNVEASVMTLAEETESEVTDEALATYKVYLPAGYDPANNSYPTVYLMPQDGYDADQYITDGIQARLDELMATDDVLSMIVIMPEFDEGDDYRAMLDMLVADVESKYAAIDNASYRAILGVGVGGYMALETTLISKSETFFAVGSHMGDFTSEENPYLENGSLNDAVNAMDESRDKGYAEIGAHYYYVDAPNEDPFSTVENGTATVGANLEKRTNPYYRYGMSVYSIQDLTMVEYAILDGEANADFYLGSMERSLNRFSNRFTENLYSASLTCTPQAVTSKNETITATVKFTLTEGIAEYAEATPAVEMTIVMTDPNSGEVLYTEAATLEDLVAGTEAVQTFELNRGDMAEGTNTTVSVTANFLGMDQDLASLSLVNVQDMGEADNEKLVDLMGDWYFNAYRAYRGDAHDWDKIENITPEVYEEWGVVQPGLGWWTADFDESLGGQNNFGGYAWYVRTFEVPEDFPTEGLLLGVGKFDEANEVYVNGVLVGSNGIVFDENGLGTYDGSNPWDVNNVYELDSSILNYGGTNTIAVRMCNSTGAGGWYEGPIGVYSVAAYNKAYGKPSVYASEEVEKAVLDVVAAQTAAIEAEDIIAYAETLDEDFFESGYENERQTAKVQAWMDAYENIKIEDDVTGVFEDGDLYNYQAVRTMTGTDADGNEVTILSEEISEYYAMNDDKAIMYGSHSRFYVDDVESTAWDGTEYEGNQTFRVYLPEGYFDEGNTEEYQTLYLLHGINSTSMTYEIDKIDQVMDEAIASGEINKTIVIIPDDPAKTSFWRGNAEKMVIEEIMPAVDARYRTIADKDYRYVAGCSMGGGGAMSLGLNYPDLFTGIVSFYGAISLDKAESMTTEELSQYKIFMACGNQDMYNFYIVQEQMSHLLDEKGVEHYHVVDNGEHTTTFYLPRFVEAIDYVENETPYDSTPFTDVEEGRYYYDAVKWAVDNGIANGKTDTTFAPADDCTRAEIVTFLWRANGCPEPTTTENPFTDVEEGRYYYDAVLWAVEKGITKGMTDTEFGTNEICTRGQIVTFLMRAQADTVSENAENPFTDVEEGRYYYDAVLWAVENEITTGKTITTFAPAEECTRAQAVTFLYRAYQ